MTLAQRLDELAAANAEGRLSDDEYRLLRQNLFERYGSGAVVPGEAPIVPIIGGFSKHARAASSSSTTSSPPQPRSQSIHVESTRISLISPTRQKSSGVASFIRIATGKRDSLANPSITVPVAGSPKRSLVSRILSRKGSKILSVRTDIPVPRNHSSSPSRPSPVPVPAATLAPPSPLSPSRSHSPSRTPSILSPSTSHHALEIDVYSDNNLITSQDIQQEISLVETEYGHFLDVFKDLELRTLTRTQAQELRRLPVYTPTSPLMLMASQDWRDFVRADASSSALPAPDSSDRLSLRSTSSRKSSRSSLSANIFNRGKLPSTPQRVPSPLSQPRRSPSTKKSSISSLSLSSHSASQLSSTRLNLASSSLHPGSQSSVKSSRSVNYLPLSTLPERRVVDQDESHHPNQASVIDLGDSDEGAVAAEDANDLTEIRRRKDDMRKRYDARLEYLRARLKSAQLHEKLLRK